jgi:Tfp pilus assembly protein FimT
MAAGREEPSRFLFRRMNVMTAQRRALTLVEAIVIVMVLGALAFIAVPRLNFAAIYRKQADTVARKIATDLRRTRTLAIANAATNSTGYSLRITGQTYQIIDDSNSATVDTEAIDAHISCTGGTDFQFGPLGNLRTGSSPLTVSAEGRTYTITVISATGIVECTGG